MKTNQSQPDAEEQMQSQGPIVQSQPSLPVQMPDYGRSTLMTGSLPPIASGADVYARQFYGGNGYRRRRFLPVNLS